ncbi:MAG: hypothetical protein ACJAXI_000322 [Crocinitomicaceae bacterium]|jgi:hypothetical protein
MKYLFQAGILVGLFCFLTACSEEDKVIARVGETELTESDAYVLMKHRGYDSKDKEQYRAFINEWCESEIFNQELKVIAPEKWKLIQLRSQMYQGDLSKFYLEEIKINKSLDTIVSLEESQAYYDSHKDEFILNDYIVKALYLKIPKDLDFKKEEVHLNYLLKNDKDLAEINSYAKLYAENYYFDDSVWIYFDKITEDIPLTKYNIDNIVLSRTKTYFSDEKHWYFLNIIDYKLKDEAPPLDFLKDQIHGIIVSKRLNDLREKNEVNLIKELKKKHEVTIYN